MRPLYGNACSLTACFAAIVKNVVISSPRLDVSSCNCAFKVSSILIVTFVFAIYIAPFLLLLYSPFLQLSMHCINSVRKIKSDRTIYQANLLNHFQNYEYYLHNYAVHEIIRVIKRLQKILYLLIPFV